MASGSGSGTSVLNRRSRRPIPQPRRSQAGQACVFQAYAGPGGFRPARIQAGSGQGLARVEERGQPGHRELQSIAIF